MSAGWVWQPLDCVVLFPLEAILSEPQLLDHSYQFGIHFDAPIASACFQEDSHVIFATARAVWEKFEEGVDEPGRIGIYDAATRSIISLARTDVTLGTLMPVGMKHVIGFFDHPRLVETATGKVLFEWNDLSSGRQESSIMGHVLPLPPFALDPTNNRFAVADAEKITVITLDPAAIE